MNLENENFGEELIASS